MLFPAPCRRGARRLSASLTIALLAVQILPAQTAPAAAHAAPSPLPAAASSAAPAPPKAISPRQRDDAERAYLRGAKELEEARFTDAEKHFAQAVAKDSSHYEYLQALALAQEHRITGLLQQAAQARPTHPEQADRLLAEARGVDAQNPRVTQHDGSIHDAPAPRSVLTPLGRLKPSRPVYAGAIQVEPSPGLQSFHLASGSNEMAQAIATAYGIRTVIDTDLQSKPLRIDLDDVDYPTAMRVFSMLSGTFATPLDAHSVLIAQDSAANRTRLEHLLEQVLPLPGYSPEQITDVANMVRSVFELKQVSVEAQMGAIAIRAPQDTMTAIDGILGDLLDTGSEVMVDLKLYSVDTEKVRNIGVQLPQSLSVFDVRSEAANIVSQNQSLINQLIANGILPANTSPVAIAAYLVFVAGVSGTSILKNTFLAFGGGFTQFGLAAGIFPVLNLALRDTDARSLEDLQLRVADRQTAIFKSGTRYPIQTSLFSNVATATNSTATINGVSVSSLISQYLGTGSLGSQATIPQIQYEDLGLTVKAVPHVQRDGVVGLKLEIKISALSGAAINGIPILASRQFSSDLTLNDGETALMASNVTQSELYAVSGIPGLSELPGFQSTTNKNSDKLRSNLVLLITPHIVRHAHEQAKGPYLPLQPRSDSE